MLLLFSPCNRCQNFQVRRLPHSPFNSTIFKELHLQSCPCSSAGVFSLCCHCALTVIGQTASLLLGPGTQLLLHASTGCSYPREARGLWAGGRVLLQTCSPLQKDRAPESNNSLWSTLENCISAGCEIQDRPWRAPPQLPLAHRRHQWSGQAAVEGPPKCRVERQSLLPLVLAAQTPDRLYQVREERIDRVQMHVCLNCCFSTPNSDDNLRICSLSGLCTDKAL